MRAFLLFLITVSTSLAAHGQAHSGQVQELETAVSELESKIDSLTTIKNQYLAELSRIRNKPRAGSTTVIATVMRASSSIKESPNFVSATLGGVEKGDSVRVMDAEDDRVLVEFGDLIGWVRSSALDMTPELSQMVDQASREADREARKRQEEMRLSREGWNVEIIGEEGRVDVRVSWEDETFSRSVGVPWHRTITPNTGDFVHFSAQLDSGGNPITIELRKDGRLIKRQRISGQYNVGTISHRIE